MSLNTINVSSKKEFLAALELVRDTDNRASEILNGTARFYFPAVCIRHMGVKAAIDHKKRFKKIMARVKREKVGIFKV